jgi:hypothetical protein
VGEGVGPHPSQTEVSKGWGKRREGAIKLVPKRKVVKRRGEGGEGVVVVPPEGEVGE